MASRRAYEKLRSLILQKLRGLNTAAYVAEYLMMTFPDELARMRLIAVRPNDSISLYWNSETVEEWKKLTEKVRHQLENLVKAGKVKKVVYDGHHGRMNFAHRTAHYYLKEG